MAKANPATTVAPQPQFSLESFKAVCPYQSVRTIADQDGLTTTAKVRSVNTLIDDETGATKYIVNLDLTTDKRLRSVINEYKAKMLAGDESPIDAQNLSFNVLPKIDTDDDFTGRFIPARGEVVKVQLGLYTYNADSASVKNGNRQIGDVITVVSSVSAMPVVAATTTDLEALFATDVANDAVDEQA